MVCLFYHDRTFVSNWWILVFDSYHFALYSFWREIILWWDSFLFLIWVHPFNPDIVIIQETSPIHAKVIIVSFAEKYRQFFFIVERMYVNEIISRVDFEINALGNERVNICLRCKNPSIKVNRSLTTAQSNCFLNASLNWKSLKASKIFLLILHHFNSTLFQKFDTHRDRALAWNSVVCGIRPIAIVFHNFVDWEENGSVDCCRITKVAVFFRIT